MTNTFFVSISSDEKKKKKTEQRQRIKLLYLTWNHHHHYYHYIDPSLLSQRVEKEKKEEEEKNAEPKRSSHNHCYVSIKEKKRQTRRQLTLHRVYTTNDCFGRRPSVRSFLVFLFFFCALHYY